MCLCSSSPEILTHHKCCCNYNNFVYAGCDAFACELKLIFLALFESPGPSMTPANLIDGDFTTSKLYIIIMGNF